MAEPEWDFPKGTWSGSLRGKQTQRDVMGRAARVAPRLVGTSRSWQDTETLVRHTLRSWHRKDLGEGRVGYGHHDHTPSLVTF